MYEKLKTDGIIPSKAFMKKLIDNKPVKPNLDKINLELNSICCNFKKCDKGKFNGFIELYCLGKTYGKIRIPVKFHRHNKKYSSWNLKNSFLISNKFIDFRWEKSDEKVKTEGIIVGCDQGIKDVVVLSDGQKPPQLNQNRYSLDSIMKKLSKQKKGSKAFKKTQDHRKNFINWSINQLNLNNIKQINLEKIYNINYKKRSSRYLKHWTNALIRDKLKNLCELSKVLIKEQESTYKSQRCSECGMVRKSNRKGKLYSCINCGNIIDADLNASLNHEIELPEVSYEMRNLNLNRSGFFWKPEGFFNLNGEVFTVPLNPSIK
jgi:transposase